MLDALRWRYSTKKYDLSKAISREDIDEIMESFRLAPSPFGIQPGRLILVEDLETRKKLLEYTPDGNKWRMEHSPYILVVAHEGDLSSSIPEYMDITATELHMDRSELDGRQEYIQGYLNSMTPEQRDSFATSLTMLAYGMMLAFIASKKIDSGTLAPTDASGYDRVLGLDKKGWKTMYALSIGYRDSENDEFANSPKVRFPKEKVFEYIK